MTLAALIALSILSHIGFAGSRVTVSLYALKQGASPLAVGILLALYAVMPMLLSIASGRLMDRVGTRWPLAASLVGIAVAIAIPSQFAGMWTLALLAVGAGTAFLFMQLSVQHAVGQLATTGNRTNNYSWLALGFSLSGFLGPTTAGLAIDNFGFTQTFALLAVFPLAALLPYLLAWRALPGPQTLFARDDDDSVLDLLTDSDLRRVFVAISLLSTAWDFYVFIVPVYGTSIGLSATTIGFLLGTFAAATFVVRLFLPWLSKRLDPWRVIFGAMAIAALALALFPLTRAVPALLALSFLLGLGLGSTQPVVLTLIHEGAPPGREGEALGLRTTVVSASNTVLPLASGVVGLAVGVLPIFWSVAAMLGMGMLYARRHWRRKAD